MVIGKIIMLGTNVITFHNTANGKAAYTYTKWRQKESVQLIGLIIKINVNQYPTKFPPNGQNSADTD